MDGSRRIPESKYELVPAEKKKQVRKLSTSTTGSRLGTKKKRYTEVDSRYFKYGATVDESTEKFPAAEHQESKLSQTSKKRTKQRCGSGGKGSQSAKASRLGTILGRSKANPLKHLAIILLKKLQNSQGKACNLLQIAKEIHNEAKDKHNPTLRRIYDVVNVCEGAGLLVRTLGSSFKKHIPFQKSCFLAPKFESMLDTGNQIPVELCPRRVFDAGLKLKGKRRSRGTEIRWLGPISSNKRLQFNPEQLLHEEFLRKDRDEICCRLTEKNVEYQNLIKQLQMKHRLVEYNQSREFSSHENQSVFWNDSDLYDLSLRDILEICQDEDCCHRSGVKRMLHMPFVIIATESRTNIDITMEGDPTYRVDIRFDKNFQLYDHIQFAEMLLNKTCV